MRLFLLLLLVIPFSAHADPARIAQLVDYVGVDYPAAVQDGKVVSELEFGEMTEFAATIRDQLHSLPTPLRKRLEDPASRLQALIEQHASASEVARVTSDMREILLDSPMLASVPDQLPDLSGSTHIYEQQCAACHGANGHGDGPAATGIEPAPTDFTDPERARERTLYGLYNTITLGVEGTAMKGFGALSDRERWALAFLVGGLHIDSAISERGEIAFTDLGPLDKPELRELTTLTLNEVAARESDLRADIHAYLRKNPGALEDTTSPIAVAMAGVNKALDEYRGGNAVAAHDAAVDAYLEGFELAEASLSAGNPELVMRTERAMTTFRQGIRDRQSIEIVETNGANVLALLQEGADSLGGESLSDGIAFSSALVIIVREGLEAILILGAIAAFLAKTGHRHAMPWLHAGWIGALVLGVLTWVVSEFFLTISGATRELTEGLTALLAAGILFYVGFWMHSKLNAARWQQFIREKVQLALDSRALGAITLIAFVAVYREVFETVLFFQALLAQTGPGGSRIVTSGFVLGFGLIVMAAWGIFRFGVRLPLKQFFGFSAAAMIILAIVFAGKGVMALQEAGVLPIHTLGFDPIGWLGIYPSLQAILAQLLVIAAAVALIVYNGRSMPAAQE